MFQIWYIMNMRPAFIHPKTREKIRGFPEDIKDKLGQSIFDIQRGIKLALPRSRSMPSIGKGVEELRVKGMDGIYRAFYYTKDARGILVFHAFMKKTQKTPPLEIELGRKRLSEMLYEKN